MTSVPIKPESKPHGIELTDWIEADWQTFLALSEQPSDAKAKFYYFQGKYKIEHGVGADRGGGISLVALLVLLFCMVRDLANRGLTRVSYRKPGVFECQPDLSYYLGDRSTSTPCGNSVANLDRNPPPSLAIEVADPSLASDLEVKQRLYAEMQIDEYWVVDVQSLKISAFTILSAVGSERIRESRVIAGLSIDLLETALQKGQELDNAQLGHWFMAQVRDRQPS